jgi:antitoxin MazE
MSQATVGKLGTDLVIRLPSDVVAAARLSDGERVEIEAHDGDIVIRRAVPQVTLEQLFQGKSAEQWRAAYAGAFEWGPDIGREVVEE